MLLNTIGKIKIVLGVAAVTGAGIMMLPARPALSQSPVVVDKVEQGLISDNVYIDPALHSFDRVKLEAAAVQGHDIASRRTTVRIAVLGEMPLALRSTNTRKQSKLTLDYAQQLHDNLKLGKNPLVFLTATPPQALMIAPEISAARQRELIDEFWLNNGQDKKNPTPALVRLAEQAAAETNKTEYGNTWIMWVIFLVVTGGVVTLVVVAMRRKKAQLVQMRDPINALRANVLSGIEYLDNYMDVLPKNNPDSDQVRIFRQSASDKFDQAAKIIDRATETTDYNRAQGLLDRAQADIEQGRRYLDRATGGTGSIPGDDAMRPQPLPASQAEAEAIPANQRGVSFFSGQPAPLGALVPVTITLNGQSRQVLVTPEEADELRQGRMPQVRAFQQGDQWVPWYENQSYDPYRDYWHNQNSGWGGFGSGALTGFVAAEVLGSLFSPHYGSPWAFSTDNSYYQGYADAERRNEMNGWDGNNGGFGGFFGSGGSNDDNNSGLNNYSDEGGGWGGSSGDGTIVSAPDSIYGSGPDADASSDWSGDSGGADFGSSDFGGGDSGSGDSGSTSDW